MRVKITTLHNFYTYYVSHWGESKQQSVTLGLIFQFIIINLVTKVIQAEG